jgi:hypothetical protein
MDQNKAGTQNVPGRSPRWWTWFTLKNAIAYLAGFAFADVFAAQASPYLGPWWANAVAFVLGVSLALFTSITLALLTLPKN